MKAKRAKKLVSSLAALAALLAAFAACDLGLTPYVAPTDGGAQVPFDSGNTVVETGTPEAGADAAMDAGDAAAGPKRVFVSSGKVAGDFNGQHGQAGADAICQGLATTARLNGRFVAWVSETVVGRDAIDHLTDVGPWYLPDRRTLVFANKAAIPTGPSKPIDMDETGSSLSMFDASRVWTGTLANGRVDGRGSPTATCADWTIASGTTFMGVSGDPHAKNADWTAKFTDNCAPPPLNRLYCFEQ